MQLHTSDNFLIAILDCWNLVPYPLPSHLFTDQSPIKPNIERQSRYTRVEPTDQPILYVYGKKNARIINGHREPISTTYVTAAIEANLWRHMRGKSVEPLGGCVTSVLTLPILMHALHHSTALWLMSSCRPLFAATCSNDEYHRVKSIYMPCQIIPWSFVWSIN